MPQLVAIFGAGGHTARLPADHANPHFLGTSQVVVAITVTGDAPCRATDVDYRTDTPSARAFLATYVSLP